MRIDAALADQPQIWQKLKQRLPDLRPLADEDQNLGFAQPVRQLVDVLGVIIPDRNVMAVELGETRQRAYRVEVIVENRDFHECHPKLRHTIC
jgi:hypothetical protein